jgi:hypothetical protein
VTPTVVRQAERIVRRPYLRDRTVELLVPVTVLLMCVAVVASLVVELLRGVVL